VRIVTVHTVFANREVFPKERPTLVRMALITRVIDGSALQQGFGETAVRVVTIGTCHLTFAEGHVRPLGHWHVRGTPDLRLPVFVTLEAGCDLCFFFHLMLGGRLLHHLMAVRAGHPTRFMRAAIPIRVITLLVTVQTDGIVGFDRPGSVIISERNNSSHATSATSLRMRRSGAMAVFAFHFSFLDFANLAHEGLLKCSSLTCVTPQTNLRSDNHRVISAITTGAFLGGCF